MYDRQLSQIIDQAFLRIAAETAQASPFMAREISAWMNTMHHKGPADYFKHPFSFPMLLLPWWAEKAIRPSPDTAFQADLAHSTINGYYYIRLIDNLMDGHATVEMDLLPSLGYFHTQFQAAYQRHFEHDHPFWEFFKTAWFHSAAATMKDSSLTDLDQDQFVQVAARKTYAARIPVAAVCYKCERIDLIPAWSQFLDSFGCWHQMWNDILGWYGDGRNQNQTYFLSEVARRKHPTESVTEWVIKGGFDWGIQLLKEWMAESQRLASGLGSEDLAVYLGERETMLLEQAERLATGLRGLAELLDLPSQR
ncbi:MAG: hypothetical protein GWN58_19565 [Anaerolineae bacterium]|nr:hypothetical protein [Anaerolineae bacterium]